MKRIITGEIYQLLHSRKFLMIVLLMLLMSVGMYSFSMGKECTVVYALVEQNENEGPILDELVGKIRELKGTSDYSTYFWMTEESMELLQEGGALWEDYHRYDLLGRMVLRQMVDAEFAELEDTTFAVRWNFHHMLKDYSAVSFSAIIFTIFFFGIDFEIRSYQREIFAGISRRRILWGRYLVFIFAFLLLSLLEMLLAMIIYNPQVIELSMSMVVKGVALRCAMDVGLASMFVLIPFLCRKVGKSMAVAFIAMLLFLSNRAVIDLNPYQFIDAVYWEGCMDEKTTICLLLVTVTLVIGSGVCSTEYFSRTELK